MKGLLTTAVFWLCVAGSIFAQSSQDEAQLKEQASTWFEDAQFAKAYPVYSQLVSLHPKDADLNFRFGSCALYAGVDKAKAVKHLKFAIDKGCDDPRAYYYLGKSYHLNYDFASAKTAYQNYLDKVSPKEKNPLPAALNMEMCMQGSELLSNIRDVVVLEKTGASFSDFYRYYDLEEIGGKVISTPEELLSKYDKKAELVSVMHFPGDAVTIYFTSYGKDGNNGKDIYKADILPGGTFSEPEKLSDNINTEYDEDFAFLHPDGKTFYFASKGHNSMGGYDIFRSEFDKYTGQFGKAVNLDFAINTPDDDVFYVVDSLKKTAYFASGRSSAQDEVHVYKVMVKSLPVSLTFIAGTYIPEADNIGTKASLKIIDELTGMPVIETTASMGEDGYLLDLPKGGKYRIDVQPEGSAIIHTGVFDVPFGTESAAWAQELKIIEENGQEKLVITNYFDQSLDVNIAALSAELLRQKAGLNPNANEDVLKQLEEQEDQGIREDLTVDQLTAVVGFNASTTIETIQVEMKEQADQDEQLANQLRNHSGNLLEEASTLNELANQQLKEAEQSMDGLTKDDMELYARTLVAYQELVLNAEENRRKASNALEAAIALDKEAERLQTASSVTRENLDALENALADSELDVAKEVLEGEYTRQSEEIDQLLVIQETETLANEKESLEEDQLGQLSNLRSKEDDLAESISSIERQLESATKKSVRAQLEQDLASANAEYISVQDDIQRKVDQTNKLGREEENLRAQITLFREAEGTELETTTSFNKSAAAALAQEISSTASTVEILTMNDSESLAIVNEEKRATRNDIQILEGIQAQAIASDVELKPVAGLKSDYSAQLQGIQNSSISPSQQTRALISTELRKVESQIAFMRSMNVENLSNEEAVQRLKELKLANEWRNELEEEAKEIDNTEEPLTASETVDRAKQFYPNEVNDLNKNAAAGEELTIDAQRYDAAFRLEMQANEQIQANNAAIITSDDAAEVAALNEENRRLRSITEWSEAQTTVNDLTVSYENDQRDVIDRELNFQDQTESQILLTEAYIEMLERLEQSRGQKMSEDELSELNAKILQSKNRLDGYKADLELALSTEEAPSTETVELVTLPETLPRDVVSIRENIAPQKSAAEQIVIASEEIEERTAAIDFTNNEEEKERLQLEIGLLEELISSANDEIELASTPEESATTAETVLPIELAASESESVVLELAELFTPVEMISVNEVEEHPQLEVLSEELAGEAQFEKALGQITESLDEIDRLEAEMQGTTKTSKQRKLDKQIEDSYFDKASAEVKRSMMFSDKAQELFEANEQAIQEAVEVENEALSEHIDKELADAEDLMEEAKRVREQAAPEIDDIKQAYEYNRALTLEFEALEKQERVQLLLEEQDALAQLDEDVLSDVLKGRYEETVAGPEETLVVEESIDENTTPEVTEAATVLVEEPITTTEEPSTETVEVPVETVDNTEAVALAKEKVEAEINTIKASYETIVPTSPKPEAFILRSAEIRDVAALDENWVTNYDLKEEEMNIVRRNEAYVNYVTAREELKELEATRVSLMDVRNAKAAELNGKLDRIALLEEAILAAENDAERDGLIEELKSVYRDAEVINQELTEADANVAAFDEAMNVKISQVEQLYVLLDAAEIVAEAKARVAATAVVVPVEEPTAVPEVEEVVVSTPSTPTSSPVQGVFTQYLFAYPNVLTGSIFGITDEALYSTAQPIPLNPAMPEGIVYKVQVGAFRNAIPQDHFGRFAPLAGEELNNGITRYTAGLFIAYNSADDAKEQIRDLGYSDAFVVAFKNGERISLSQAREELGETSGGAVASNTAPVVDPVTSSSDDSRNLSTESTESTPSQPVVNASTPSIPSFADNWKNQTGVYYTVQIGVYSKEVTASDLNNTPEILADQTSNGFIRYTSGKFASLSDAEARKTLARELGVVDAFVSVYVNGKRVSVSAAAAQGTSTQESNAPTSNSTAPKTYQLKIGSFDEQVPSSVARALLMLEAKWGIYQVKEAGQTVYYTRVLDSESESDRAERDFQDFEVEVESVLIK